MPFDFKEFFSNEQQVILFEQPLYSLTIRCRQFTVQHKSEKKLFQRIQILQ